jgi:hypothetical protein
MIRHVRAAIAAAALAGAGGPALAHHSFAMFDREREVVLTGVVKEFQWTNPHTWLQLNVAGPQGATTEWSIEGLSTGTLSRQGWKPRSFKPGDRVTVKIYPMKDGSAGGSFIGATLPDGSTLGKM